jgi:RNA polymerase-binding transcription factor DksA
MDSTQLEAFRARLLAEKALLIAEREQREKDNEDNAQGQYDEGTQGEMADIASDLYDKDLILNEIAENLVRMKEIEAALERIDKGTYGLSVISGKSIPIERLEALPWADRLVEEAK